jgi:hypothetical protein
MNYRLTASVPPGIHLLKAETAGTPETSVPVHETSGHQQTAVVNIDSNVIQKRIDTTPQL